MNATDARCSACGARHLHGAAEAFAKSGNCNSPDQVPDRNNAGALEPGYKSTHTHG